MRRIGAKGEGHFHRISWDEALDEVSLKFKETIKMHEMLLSFGHNKALTEHVFLIRSVILSLLTKQHSLQKMKNFQYILQN